MGDGRSIKVWKDRWLPTPITHTVQSHPRVLVDNAMITALINPERRCWNVELIKEVFTVDEARVIENIPLSHFLPLDRLIWRGTKNGVFTMQSAYHLSKELLERVGGQSSYVEKDQGVRKVIWSMEVSNPVKLFIWHACHNLLPTKENLFKRKVVEESTCPCCGRDT